MKSDDAMLLAMRDRKIQENQAVYEKLTKELRLFLEYIERESVLPDTWHFSITRMRIIPLWTIYDYYSELETREAFVTSTGKLYVYRGGILGKLPALRRHFREIGDELARNREKREWKQIEQRLK